MSFRLRVTLSVFLFLLAPLLRAQTPSLSPAGAEVAERIAPSVALVLVGDGGRTQGEAIAVVVRSDGVLLTTYHTIKEASAVQIQLQNGETFDRVDLLAYDERRDVAAVRISGTGLATAPIAGLADVRPGQQAYVVSHVAGSTWTTSAGIISGVKMADEVPGAGHGYRLLEFTAPISPESSGGILVDAQGRTLGIAVGTLAGGQNLNFAVPLESVLGLAQMSGGTTFPPGAGLRPTTQETPPIPPPPAPPPAPPPRRGVEVFRASESEPEVQPINPTGSELSRAIDSHDPIQILRNFRTMFIISRTVWLKVDLMQEAMQKEPAFTAWGLAIVSDPRIADVRLTVDRVLFTWTWTYEMVHQNSGIILATGKLNAIAGGAATSKIADAVVLEIGKARGIPAGVARPAIH
ncbi:MAG: S1C family serine protease [Acidobacteriia bacterium]|nr:S1C family serine protease [Terriglobia bacterium]